MSLSECASKAEIVAKYRVHEKDSGSPEVQIALITHRLGNLSEHLSRNPQDKLSQRGLLKLVSKRKRLLNYLRKENVDRYKQTLTKLDIRK